MKITINGKAKTTEEWAKVCEVSADIIQGRYALGYKGDVLLLSKRDWRLMDELADAEPRDDYEKVIRKMIKAEIPQFRFDIIVELCREIGLGVFKPSALRRNLSRGNQSSAVQTTTWNDPMPFSLLCFYGPKGNARLSWMITRADQVRRWTSPLER